MNGAAVELTRLLAREDFAPVYREADRVRRARVGDVVHLRAILEFSNHCQRRCAYCGLNARNGGASRFRMTPEEMIAAARRAHEAGYRTLVMQSGEDAYFTPQLLGEIVRQIARETGMAVTLSCGEMSRAAYAHLKACGARRYLLKHETSDARLYAQLHPGGSLKSRLACLRALGELGYEVGGGFMVGLPGQTLETIADDLLLLRDLNCKMAGIGPFLPHPATPLGAAPPGSAELTKRAVALARLLLPEANLPATTALGVLGAREKSDVFSCGANVVMRKITPDPYKQMYEIYPAKLEPTDVKLDRARLEAQVRSLGRIPL